MSAEFTLKEWTISRFLNWSPWIGFMNIHTTLPKFVFCILSMCVCVHVCKYVFFPRRKFVFIKLPKNPQLKKFKNLEWYQQEGGIGCPRSCSSRDTDLKIIHGPESLSENSRNWLKSHSTPSKHKAKDSWTEMSKKKPLHFTSNSAYSWPTQSGVIRRKYPTCSFFFGREMDEWNIYMFNILAFEGLPAWLASVLPDLESWQGSGTLWMLGGHWEQSRTQCLVAAPENLQYHKEL